MAAMRAAICLIAGAFALSGCSREAETDANAVADAPTTDSAAVAPTPVAYASLTGDPAAGERLFLQCRACHTVEPAQNRVGPTLHGIVGKRAGQVPGYNYSPANRNSGLTWTEDELFNYLESPQKVVPGTKMAFGGVKNPQARADLIAYLKTAS